MKHFFVFQILLLVLVAMAASQVNVVDNNNPGGVNVVDNSDPNKVHVVEQPDPGIDSSFYRLVDLDPAFYQPSDPNAPNYPPAALSDSASELPRVHVMRGVLRLRAMHCTISTGIDSFTDLGLHDKKISTGNDSH
ncbi:hypothetical protein MSG28_008798 [Choristoneura fumiferana]|uniref:Uncharacterized protein n=1 Tax=Choristoneura fumiferana TaxID=7141 RepID=A0ACC0J823_CHOFU|nr:hypothetical protein MSG28_008798 [Choristoneura fumiferana]